MKVIYEATIPTGTYANIRPRIEFDDADDLDNKFEQALNHFIHVAKTCSDNPASVKRNGIKK